MQARRPLPHHHGERRITLDLSSTDSTLLAQLLEQDAIVISFYDNKRPPITVKSMRTTLDMEQGEHAEVKIGGIMDNQKAIRGAGPIDFSGKIMHLTITKGSVFLSTRYTQS